MPDATHSQHLDGCSFPDVPKMQTVTPLKSRKTEGYCWRISFKVLEVLFLAQVSQAFLPSKQACGIHTFQHFWVRQQYPSLFCDICDSALPSQTNTFGLHEEFGLLTARRIRNIRSASS